MTDQEKIQKLQQENKQLKETLKEGRNIYNNMNEILGIKKAVESNMLMFYLPRMIPKITSNPQMIADISQYSNKLNEMDLD